MLIKGLIVVQFGLAITLMIGTYVMQGQINFILNKDLGFNPENVVAVEINSELQNALKIGQLYSEEAQRIPGVLSTSITAGHYRDYSEYGVVDIGMAQMKSATTLSQLGDGIPSEAVDAQYLQTMDIELLKGVNFSKQANTFPSDEVIVNQAFVDAMGWDNPIGQILEDKPENQGWVGPFDGKKVIGVIENYHFKSLYDPLQPMVLQHIEAADQNPGTILIRLSSDRMSETISNLKSLWNSIAEQEAFNLAFMDDMVQRQYNEEIRWNRIIRISSMASILLACFGLFGLSALVAQRRIKEIGIRKVFGASIKNILVLISKDFVLLVVCGFAISAPVAWYLSNQWLTGFSYKIDLDALPFLYGGLTVLLIALTTVSWQSVKAALQNPVENLRNE
ncbi:MAG: FtsX-like permease family protein [Balneola sp.]|nr:FtsX-like permease family protein [Balneola sp.]